MLQCSRNLIIGRCYFTCSVLQYHQKSFQQAQKRPVGTKQKKWFQAKGGMKSKPNEMLELDERQNTLKSNNQIKSKEELEELRATAFDAKPVKRLWDTPTPKCIEDLSEEFASQLTGEGPRSISKKFALDKVKRSLQYLASRDYPLPDQLTESQWHQILKYETNRTITLYMFAISDGQDNDPEVLKELEDINEYPSKPLTVDDELLNKMLDNDQHRERWQYIRSVYETMQMEGSELWPFPTEREIASLLAAKSNTELKSCFTYLAKVRLKDLKDVIDKRAANVKGMKIKADFEDAEERGEIVYSQSRNSIFQRFTDNKMKYWNDYTVFRSIGQDWGQDLVIDMSYYNLMSYREQKSLAYRELLYAVRYNRECPEPFHLHFTNFDAKSMTQVVKAKLDINELIPDTFTDKCPTELFDPSRLVYLSPNSKDYYEYNPDDICIIGGLVDNSIQSKVSLAKAKTLSIRHAKIPTKPVLGFECVLNVETMVAIMLDYNRTRDWNYALRWVPARFLKNNYLKQPYTFRQEYAYLTHKKLSPSDGFDSAYGKLCASQYKHEYKKLMSLAPKSNQLQDPAKYVKAKLSHHFD